LLIPYKLGSFLASYISAVYKSVQYHVDIIPSVHNNNIKVKLLLLNHYPKFMNLNQVQRNSKIPKHVKSKESSEYVKEKGYLESSLTNLRTKTKVI
jgi:hypothetical protein